MARTRTISDDQILEAAREVFLEAGLSGTTAEIARRAEISEGTIFKRFATKEQLFFAAMAISAPPWLKRAWSSAPDEHTVRQRLHQICLELIAFFEEAIPKMMMVMCAQGGFSKERFGQDAPPVRAIKALSLYLQQEQRRGRLGPCDAQILARMLISSCHHYAFMEQAGIQQYLPMPREQYVQGVLDNLFGSLEVDP